MIQIRGLDEINNNLATLPDRLAKKVISQAERKSMKIMQRAVQAEAPEGETDQLKMKVKVRAGKRSRGKISVDVVTVAEDFADFYASYVVLGAVTWPDPDNYYLRAAAEVGQQCIDVAIAEILAGAMREAAR